MPYRMIDAVSGREYHLDAMKVRLLKKPVLTAALTACAGCLFAEDLDAALEAQKKKARRQTYSESARLENRNLEVPKAPTDQEKELDRKLRELEARAPESISMPEKQMVPSRIAVAPARQDENKDWLISAVMDNKAAENSPGSEEETWLQQELARQKSLKDQDAAAKEEEQVKKLMQEQKELQSSIPAFDRLKQYRIDPQNPAGDKDSSVGLYKLPQQKAADPLASFSLQKKKEPPEPPPLFSPEAARLSKTAAARSSTAVKSPLLNPFPGTKPGVSMSGFPNRADKPEPAPLTPIEMIRKASPINRDDPFSDNVAPQIRRSIWD